MHFLPNSFQAFPHSEQPRVCPGCPALTMPVPAVGQHWGSTCARVRTLSSGVAVEKGLTQTTPRAGGKATGQGEDVPGLWGPSHPCSATSGTQWGQLVPKPGRSPTGSPTLLGGRPQAISQSQ